MSGVGGAIAAPVPVPEPAQEERPAANSAKLERFLRSAQPVAPGNAGGRYLARRGLDIGDAVGLRYHPSAYLRLDDGELGQMPAILAPIRGLDGRLEASTGSSSPKLAKRRHCEARRGIPEAPFRARSGSARATRHGWRFARALKMPSRYAEC